MSTCGTCKYFDDGYCKMIEAYRDSDDSSCKWYEGCILVTACVKFMHKENDCIELTTLRKIRDEELLTTTEGKELVENYYIIAPKILKAISKERDEVQKEVYAMIYDKTLMCIGAYFIKEYNLGITIYKNMVLDLVQKFKIE